MCECNGMCQHKLEFLMSLLTVDERAEHDAIGAILECITVDKSTMDVVLKLLMRRSSIEKGAMDRVMDS